MGWRFVYSHSYSQDPPTIPRVGGPPFGARWRTTGVGQESHATGRSGQDSAIDGGD
jgi:hypothetical protein